jgi:hypothetical protein
MEKASQPERRQATPYHRVNVLLVCELLTLLNSFYWSRIVHARIELLLVGNSHLFCEICPWNRTKCLLPLK